MSFGRKKDGSGPSSSPHVRYSEITEGPPATPVKPTAEALQRLTLNVEASFPERQGLSTLHVDVYKLADTLRSVRTDLTQHLERSIRKQRPKTAYLHTTLAENRREILSKRRFLSLKEQC